jgi:hypothetical protein
MTSTTQLFRLMHVFNFVATAGLHNACQAPQRRSIITAPVGAALALPLHPQQLLVVVLSNERLYMHNRSLNGHGSTDEHGQCTQEQSSCGPHGQQARAVLVRQQLRHERKVRAFGLTVPPQKGNKSLNSTGILSKPQPPSRRNFSAGVYPDGAPFPRVVGAQVGHSTLGEGVGGVGRGLGKKFGDLEGEVGGEGIGGCGGRR